MNYEQALANLYSGGLQGPALQGAISSLQSYFAGQGGGSNSGGSTPTVGQAYGAPTPVDDYSEGIGYYGDIAKSKVDENKIRSSILGRFQSEIDAYNRIYGEKLAEAKRQGLGRLGSGRAIQARSGTLGSDFANTQNEDISQYNRGIEGSVQAELGAKIGEIMRTGESLAAAEIAEKRKAQTEGVGKYLEFLGKKTERVQSNLKALSKDFYNKGLSPDQLDPKNLKAIAKQYGVTEDDIKSNFATSKIELDAAKEEAALKKGKTEAEIKKIKSDIELANKEFEENKRQFGLEYALNERKQKLDELKEGIGTGSAATVEVLDEKINLIDSLLNSKGLAGSVGPYAISRVTPLSVDKADRQEFAAGVNQLVNKETIDTLVNLKARGGTLGALSDQERVLLQSAATKIGTWMQKDDKGNPTGKFEVSEKTFKKELNTLKRLAQKARNEAFGGTSLAPDETSLLDSEFGNSAVNPEDYF